MVHNMMRELGELIADPDNKRLVYRLRDVLQKYSKQLTDGKAEATTVEEDRTGEFERQRDYMEAQLSCVKRQNRQKETNLQLENQRNTTENAVLVKEINDLRHERKLLLTKCQVVESQLKEARVSLQRATSATPGLATAPSGSKSPAKDHGDDPHGGLPGSRRGKIVRGPTRAIREVAQLDSDKIARIITQVERNNAEMERQQQEILRLREFVAQLLLRAEAEAGAPLTAEEQRRHDEIRRHLGNTMTPAPAPASASLPSVAKPATTA